MLYVDIAAHCIMAVRSVQERLPVCRSLYSSYSSKSLRQCFEVLVRISYTLEVEEKVQICWMEVNSSQNSVLPLKTCGVKQNSLFLFIYTLQVRNTVKRLSESEKVEKMLEGGRNY